MEKRNTLLLTVIAIATLLVAVVGATFAYLANDVGVKQEDGSIAVEKGSAKFFATGSSMAINVSSDAMNAIEVGQNYASNQGTLNVTYNSAGTRETSCNYDVYFRWTSSDKYLAHSKYLEGENYLDNDGKEFTLMVSALVGHTTGTGITGTQYIDVLASDPNHEADYSLIKDCDTNEGCKIGSGVVYSNTSDSNEATSVTWTFKTTMYNLEHMQNDPVYGIAGKNYTGEFFVTNVTCF